MEKLRKFSLGGNNSEKNNKKVLGFYVSMFGCVNNGANDSVWRRGK